MAKKKTVAFEQLLAETEEIVERLESGELDLDGSLQQYEKGVANLRRCAELVAAAEEKVRVIIERNDGELEFTDLDEGTSAAEEA